MGWGYLINGWPQENPKQPDLWKLIFRTAQSGPKATEPSDFLRTRSPFQLSLQVPFRSFKSEVANSGPWITNHPPSACFHRPSCDWNAATPTHLLRPRLVLCSNAELSSCNRDHSAQKLKILKIWAFTEKALNLLRGQSDSGMQHTMWIKTEVRTS